MSEQSIKPGQTIIIESLLYPHTTNEEEVTPIAVGENVSEELTPNFQRVDPEVKKLTESQPRKIQKTFRSKD